MDLLCVGGQWESPADEQDSSGQVRGFQGHCYPLPLSLEGSQEGHISKAEGSGKTSLKSNSQSDLAALGSGHPTDAPLYVA